MQSKVERRTPLISRGFSVIMPQSDSAPSGWPLVARHPTRDRAPSAGASGGARKLTGADVFGHGLIACRHRLEAFRPKRVLMGGDKLHRGVAMLFRGKLPCSDGATDATISSVVWTGRAGCSIRRGAFGIITAPLVLALRHADRDVPPVRARS